MKDCLGIQDQQNRGAVDVYKPGPVNTCAPTWDASARCSRSHGSQIDALVLLKETKANSRVGIEIKFTKVEFLFKGRVEWVRGDKDHGHIVGPDEIFCNYIRRDLFLCFVVIF